MKVTFTLSIGLQGHQTETFEYDDDITDEELEEAWQDWSQNYIDGAFKREESK